MEIGRQEKKSLTPEIIPVANPRSRTLFLSGNKIIPKNIIVNIISGFMPRKNPGTTVCSTVPIPTKRARATSFFVFISHLSSSYAKVYIYSPAVHSLPAASNCYYYSIIMNFEIMLIIFSEFIHKLSKAFNIFNWNCIIDRCTASSNRTVAV